MAPADHRIHGGDLDHQLPVDSEPAPLSESEEHEADDGDGDGDAIVDTASLRLCGPRWGRALAACTAPVQCQYQGPHVKPPTPPPRG
jgi:hypothetical protein